MKRLACLIAVALIGCTAGSTSAPEIPSWPGARHAYESIGNDILHCWKVSLSEEEWRSAAASLQLKTMVNYPKYDTSPANCKVVWWDVDLPSQAQNYWISGEGHIRRLALYKDGNLYITNEIR